uniref:Uncharacterized protein n=1 Tax=Picea sitchensis TaxID=3332 RepID=D5A8J0_PICSI|nr:unknown [Picea sitchensis]
MISNYCMFYCEIPYLVFCFGLLAGSSMFFSHKFLKEARGLDATGHHTLC